MLYSKMLLSKIEQIDRDKVINGPRGLNDGMKRVIVVDPIGSMSGFFDRDEQITVGNELPPLLLEPNPIEKRIGLPEDLNRIPEEYRGKMIEVSHPKIGDMTGDSGSLMGNSGGNAPFFSFPPCSSRERF